MDLIVEPEEHETLLTGQAVISVSRFFGARVKKVCSLNFTLTDFEGTLTTAESSHSPRREPCEPGETVRVQLTAPRDSMYQRREGVLKYFFFVKEEVSSDWKDLAFFLGLDNPGIRNIENRNDDDTSCCMDMLQVWLQKRGDNATLDILMVALSNAGLQKVVDGLKSKFPEAAESDNSERPELTLN